jgi:endonuclease/exonuclease/phosphatase (EEP) superfamily protein YafD
VRGPRTLAAVCGTVAAGVTWALWLAVTIGRLGTHSWLLDLFANFIAQYLALFAVCAVVLAVVRWRKTAIVALLGVALTTAMMGPYFKSSSGLKASQPTFRLVTFNAWFRNENLGPLVKFLRATDADVVILQEVDVASIEGLAKQLTALPHHTVTPFVRHGVAVFSRWPLQTEHLQLPGSVTRISRSSVRWRDATLTVFGAHLSWPLSKAKAAARAAELHALAERARRESAPVLLAGDFNLTPWSRYFERFVAQSGLKDCALGQGVPGSWPAQAMPARIRIDHCFASDHWQVHRVVVGPSLGSDHLPIIADLELVASR